MLQEIRTLINAVPKDKEDNGNTIVISDDFEEGESSKSMSCEKCNFKTSTESQMKLHYYKSHSKQGKNLFKSNKSSECIPCELCEYIAKGHVDYALHIEIHQSDLQNFLRNFHFHLFLRDLDILILSL